MENWDIFREFEGKVPETMAKWWESTQTFAIWSWLLESSVVFHSNDTPVFFGIVEWCCEKVGPWD